MDAEQDNDLEPSLPLLAHVRTLCQDPHHAQGDFDHADADIYIMVKCVSVCLCVCKSHLF